MRPINVFLLPSKAKDPKAINLINRARALCYSFGIDLVQVPGRPKQKKVFVYDFDAEGLSVKDVKYYSSVCAQISSIIHFSGILWDLTLKENKPEDAISEIEKTKKRVRFQKSRDEDLFFHALVKHYDEVWYLRCILEKDAYLPEDRINWSLNKKELFALRALALKIKDKFLISEIEWNLENAVSSFDAFLSASITYPIYPNFKKNFSLTSLNTSFLKIYRHVRQQIGAGATADNIDSRFDQFFAARKSKQ